MTLCKRIIARLDVKGKKLIKGIRFEGLRVVGDAYESAKKYADEGIDEIFYTDAVASLYGRNGLAEILRETSKQVFIPITAGGAIRSLEDGRKLLSAGADKLAINSEAVRNPEIINQLANTFGRQCVVLSIQARKNIKANSWEVMIESGRERSGRELLEWIKEVQERGAGEIFITSVDKDGTGGGPDMELIEAVNEIVKIPLVMGGGIAEKDQLSNIFNVKNDLSGVSIGWALHNNHLSVNEIKGHVEHLGYSIRPKSICEKSQKVNKEIKVAVIDYGMGNLQSLCNALSTIGTNVIVTSVPNKVEADVWALPGVGAFPEGMHKLESLGLASAIKDRCLKGLPTIGICLGMQLLFESGVEHKYSKGLEIFPGSIKKLPELSIENKEILLPHVGWNKLISNDKIKSNFSEHCMNLYQYFVHSYAINDPLINKEYSFIETEVGGHKFVSLVYKGKVFGMQFHPERSGNDGLKLLAIILEHITD